ncbi:MAG: CHAD domain-containing protein [Planctomycetales bacterium]|nr:CHAD domain-containing protein [Planctomycetales bacterium]
MNRPEKWLPDVTPQCKIRAVARQALAARLKRVAKTLKRAVKCLHDEADTIHKLRTWSRRSAAAVELFRPLFPKKEGKWFAGKLKKVRRSAGDVRDLDVMLEQAADNPVLAEELRRQRNKARRPLERLYKRLVKSGEFEKRQKRLLKKIDQPRQRLGDWAAKRVGKQAALLVALGSQRLTTPTKSHEFRIAGKELRYVLEIIGAALPAAAVKVDAFLIDLQQRIGIICDQAAAEKMYQQLLTQVSDSERPPLRAAIAQAKKEKSRSHKTFLRWWTPARRIAFRRALIAAGLLHR